jgi:hypothetical protein
MEDVPELTEEDLKLHGLTRCKTIHPGRARQAMTEYEQEVVKILGDEFRNSEEKK